jgi:hypothetical protein
VCPAELKMSCVFICPSSQQRFLNLKWCARHDTGSWRSCSDQERRPGLWPPGVYILKKEADT